MAVDALPKKPESTPCLKVTIIAFDDDKTSPSQEIAIPMPRALSLRVAKLHAIEQIMKQMKTAGLGDALKAMGFK